MNFLSRSQKHEPLEKHGEPKKTRWAITTGLELYEALVEGEQRGHKQSIRDLSGFKLSMQVLYLSARSIAAQDHNTLRQFDTQDALLLPVQALAIDENTDFITVGIPPYHRFTVPQRHYLIWMEQSQLFEKQIADIEAHLNTGKDMYFLLTYSKHSAVSEATVHTYSAIKRSA
jgi:hypothetical protein